MTAVVTPEFGDLAPRQHATTKPWLVMLALGMGGFAIGTTEFAAMSLLPYFSAGLAIDEATASHVISAYALGVVVGAPLIAVLAARVSRRTLLLGLMAVFAVANCLSALSPSYGWMLIFRFMSGLPHGAYFGVAALVAASLVPPNKRAQAVARVMLGLTIATILGVPLATWLGQTFGWRWGFAITGLLALVTVALLWLYAPRHAPDPDASPTRELTALRNRQVWLILATAAVGSGGMFAVYSYTSATLLSVTQVSPSVVPVVMGIFGVGMTLGTLAAAWAADRWLMKTAAALLASSAVVLACFPFAAPHLGALATVIFMVGFCGGLGTVLQSRLMDVARDAQTLAAALNHSAFNAANALGPWLASIAIMRGYGFESAGFVGAGLAVTGLLIWLIAWHDARRTVPQI
ncbi:MFS transporter [Mesorhizobium microcysteis]|uniref:MFS transporter n=1 Tax=Neoaquamicrobium microcysteis TaxID=2682781 RepID=A0A5D4H0G3_9HYPH|nr:MFS transporter [Mesorhizobium microcysteis]TYR32340.1 MFS transporter [Mesorhizobium microcysteis]